MKTCREPGCNLFIHQPGQVWCKHHHPRRCVGKNKSGKRCFNEANHGTMCWVHDVVRRCRHCGQPLSGSGLDGDANPA